jgi:hypothetical protein
VIGVRKRASGLFAAISRALIATSAKCSVVVPYFAMCRRAASANICPGDCNPYGTENAIAPGMARARWPICANACP